MRTWRSLRLAYFYTFKFGKNLLDSSIEYAAFVNRRCQNSLTCLPFPVLKLLKTQSNLHRNYNLLDSLCTMSDSCCWLLLLYFYDYIVEKICLQFSSMLCSTSISMVYFSIQMFDEVIWNDICHMNLIGSFMNLDECQIVILFHTPQNIHLIHILFVDDSYSLQ